MKTLIKLLAMVTMITSLAAETKYTLTMSGVT